MRKLNQIQLDAIVDSHKKKLINGAKIIMFASMFLIVLCMYGIFADYDHLEAYGIVFFFSSLTAAFGAMMYEHHKKTFN